MEYKTTVTIIGVGLIGGSLARAIKRADKSHHIIGCSRNSAHLEKAKQLGVIDHYETDVTAAVKEADMIVVAVPLGAMAVLFKQLAINLRSSAVITDVGSAKQSVIDVARITLADRFESFVPGHPIAGTEKTGVEASFTELFDDRYVVLTPTAETNPDALERVRDLWECAGAKIVEMDAKQHDQIFAATSHVPHVLAYSLVDTLGTLNQSEEIFRFAAGGFRDFTRIASSDPVMWRDICLANRDAILEILQEFTTDLEQLTQAIKKGDGELILKTFSQAKQQRDQLLVKK